MDTDKESIGLISHSQTKRHDRSQLDYTKFKLIFKILKSYEVPAVQYYIANCIATDSYTVVSSYAGRRNKNQNRIREGSPVGVLWEY